MDKQKKGLENIKMERDSLQATLKRQMPIIRVLKQKRIL
jgi:hypothetical protein